MGYELTWITDQLAAGHAPMSYDDLDWIKSQGITAIVNLCGEYCDLHEIEGKSGFEVYYLPVFDECAPDMETLEKALEWLDEALYLNKKVLVHCRHGQGRTGTFISAYLLRRGLGRKKAEKHLKGTPAHPTNYCQWKLLRRYGKKEGTLKVAEASAEHGHSRELAPVLSEYHRLIRDLDEQLAGTGRTYPCGLGDDHCCREPFVIPLIECIALGQAVNHKLTSGQRHDAIDRAALFLEKLKALHHRYPETDEETFTSRFRENGLVCPLMVAGGCILVADRPVRCRCWPADPVREWRQIVVRLTRLSEDVYHILTGASLADELYFSVADAVSGRFVQEYFQVMLRATQENEV